MSRRRRAEKRKVEADPLYGSPTLEKFINKVMQHGKKSKARNMVYNALETFAKKTNSDNTLDAFEQALENAKPSLRSEIPPYWGRDLSSSY